MPVTGLIVSAVLMTLMLWMNYSASLVEQFTTIVSFTTFAVLLPYLYSSAADLFFILTGVYDFKTLSFVRSLFVSVISFLFTVLIVMGTGNEAIYLGMVSIFVGFPAYAWIKRKLRQG